MKMRSHISLITAAAVLLGAASAFGQATAPTPAPSTSPEPAETTNIADFAVRGTSLNDGADAFQFYRYRDLRNGATLDLFRFSSDSDTKRWSAQGDHLGYRDTRASISVNDFGRI